MQFVKVVGHSSDRLNDYADELANEGRDSNRIVDINFNYSSHSSIKFFPSFSKYSIEYKFRKFVVFLLHIAGYAEWSLLTTIGEMVSHEDIT